MFTPPPLPALWNKWPPSLASKNVQKNTVREKREGRAAEWKCNPEWSEAFSAINLQKGF